MVLCGCRCGLCVYVSVLLFLVDNILVAIDKLDYFVWSGIELASSECAGEGDGFVGWLVGCFFESPNEGSGF